MNSSPLKNRASQGLQCILMIALMSSAVLAMPNDEVGNLSQSYSFEFLTFKAERAPNTFLEVFCQIPTGKFQFIKTRDGFVAKYEVLIELLSVSGASSAVLSHRDSVNVISFDEIFVPREPHLVRFTFTMNPGDYVANVKVTDLETLAELRFDKKINLPDYYNDGLSISSLQLSNSITQTDFEGELVKNSLRILPNVAHLYGMNFNRLYVYSEIYNLNFDAAIPNGAFNTNVVILDGQGREVKNMLQTHAKPSSQSVLSFGLPIDYLSPGSYKLMVKIEDINTGETTLQSANFIVGGQRPTQAETEISRNFDQTEPEISGDAAKIE